MVTGMAQQPGIPVLCIRSLCKTQGSGESAVHALRHVDYDATLNAAAAVRDHAEEMAESRRWPGPVHPKTGVRKMNARRQCKAR